MTSIVVSIKIKSIILAPQPEDQYLVDLSLTNYPAGIFKSSPQEHMGFLQVLRLLPTVHKQT